MPATPASPQAGWVWRYPQPHGVQYGAFDFAGESTLVAAGTAGMMMRTTDGGDHWSYVSSGTTHFLHAVRFADSMVAYAVGNRGAIVKSEDGGKTWAPQASGTARTLYGLSFPHRDTGFVVGDAETILGTRDGGKTWALQNSRTARAFRAVHALDGSTAHAVGSSGLIMRTRDGGATWTSPLEEKREELLSIHMRSPDSGIAVGRKSSIARTVDSGRFWKWDSIPFDTSALSLSNLSFLDTKSGYMLVGRGSDFGILETSDGGKQWKKLAVPVKKAIETFRANRRMLVGMGVSQSIIRSFDKGDTWTDLRSGGTASWSSIQFPEASTSFAFSPSRQVLKSSDGGRNWAEHVRLDSSLAPDSIRFVTPTLGFAGGALLRRTTDGGATWDTLGGPFQGKTRFSIAFPTRDTGYISCDSLQAAYLGRTVDGGLNWDIRKLDTAFKPRAYAFPDSRTIFSLGPNSMTKSFDRGLTWSRHSTNLVPSSGAKVIFLDTAIGFHCFSSVERTTDGGRTWSRLNFGADRSIHDLGFVDQSVGYALVHPLDSGSLVFKTQDGGATWTRAFPETFPTLRTVHCFPSGSCFAAGVDGTIIEIDPNLSTSTRPMRSAQSRLSRARKTHHLRAGPASDPQDARDLRGRSVRDPASGVRILPVP